MPSNKRNLLASSVISAEVLPEAVAFNGTTDYLTRGADLTGNADGGIFTFSTWVYFVSDGSASYIYAALNDRFLVNLNGSDQLSLIGRNSSGTIILWGSVAAEVVPQNTWVNILVSIDLADTGKRGIYIQDADVSADTTWTTYTNADIDFTQTNHGVGGSASDVSHLYGRLAHVFLDYTYRDLSIEANRRLFITADLKPASGQAALSPILYMPLTDRDTAGTNAGTGGDFTINGNPQTASRGPNQDNCVASEFDGVADRLSLAGGAAINSKAFTISCNLRANTLAGSDTLFELNNGATEYVKLSRAGGILTLSIVDSSVLLSVTIDNAITADVNYHLDVSVDLSDTGKRHFMLQGVAEAVTWATYVDTALVASSAAYAVASTDGPTAFWAGSMGEFYFDAVYTDLSTSNPFWDSDTNRPKSVRKVIERTGVTPLIALPIIGNDAGTNLGSEGDFTVTSGPYTGARGGSEYWARSMLGDGNGSLKSTGIGASNGTTFSAVFAINHDDTNGDVILSIDDGVSIQGLQIYTRAGTANSTITMKDAAGATVLTYALNDSGSTVVDTWYIYLVSMDGGNTANNHMYVNGVQGAVATNTATGVAAAFNLTNITVSGRYTTTTDGYIANLYFTTDYIDFSDVDNRNLFVDRLGYPRDLTEAIADGDIPDPLIYMKLDDPDALGTNSGTGGNFTVNGTVNNGPDVGVN